MQMLKARLYEAEIRRREEAAQKEADSKSDIGWGHQIRSYVLQPYQMIKDLRTGVERSDSQRVLDGDLVVVEKRAGARRGEIVVAIVDNQFTLKRLDLERGHFLPRPENTAYPAIPPAGTP